MLRAGCRCHENSSVLSNPTSNYKDDEPPKMNNPGVQLEEGTLPHVDRNKRKPADAN
jgi:hypothetical protein